MARKSTMISVGQGRVPNTIKLRKQYTSYVVDRQSDGLDVLPFESWAAKFHPDEKILAGNDKGEK